MAYGDSTEQVIPIPMAGQRVKKCVEKKLPTEKQKWNECKFFFILGLVVTAELRFPESAL